MFKYIIMSVFMFLIVSCGESQLYDTSVKFPEDDIKDNSTPDADVAGLLNVAEGSYSIPAYTGSSYYSLIFNTPIVADDNAVARVNYTITSTGVAENVSPKYKVADNNHNYTDRNIIHNKLRQKEALLLAKDKDESHFKKRARGPKNINVGYVWNNVKIERGLSSNIELISAECIAVSNSAYFFIETGLTKPDQTLIDTYVNGFEEIYPLMHSKFGKENDFDGNGKVIILFFNSTINGLYGYFYAADKRSVGVESNSNEADILYVNSNYLSKTNDVLSTLAHEFQHMISFDIRDNHNLGYLNTWLDEGLSMQAEYFSGYYDMQSSDYLGEFLKYYNSYSLIDWDSSSSINYGYSMAYIRYLVERFGEDVVKKIIYSKYTGVKSVEEATGVGFNDIFKDFALALFISGRNVSTDEKYNFKTLDIVSKGGLSVFQDLSAGKELSTSIKPYSLQLLRWTGQLNSFNITGSVKGYGLAY